MYFYIGGIIFIIVTICSACGAFSKNMDGWHPVHIISYYFKYPLTYCAMVGVIWMIAGFFSDYFFLFLSILILRIAYLFTPMNEKQDVIIHRITSIIEINIVAFILFIHHSNN